MKLKTYKDERKESILNTAIQLIPFARNEAYYTWSLAETITLTHMGTRICRQK